MRIEFHADTNKDYCMINTAVFKVQDMEVVLDRDTTEYTIEDGHLDMLWRNVYIHAITDKGVTDFFDDLYLHDNTYTDDWEFVRFELEDDAPDADYDVKNVKWCV